MVLLPVGKEKDAIDAFNSYIAKYPKSEIANDVKLWLGQYFYNRDEYAKAKGYFDSILADPSAAEVADDAEYWLAFILYKNGDLDGAIKQFERIIEVHPDSQLAVESTIKIGDILAQSGKADDAIKELKSIIEKHPGTRFEKVANKKIGDILKERKLFNAAIEKYRLAITEKQSEFNAETQFAIGESYEELGDNEEALSEYLKVKYLYPEITYWSARAGLRAAYIFEVKQRWNDARKIYEEMAGADLEEAKYAKERLEWIRNHVGDTAREVN